MYKAYVTTIKNVRKHPNADRLQLGECFGNTVCVNLDYTEGQIGVYFPTDGQLSVEFAEANNLLRKKDADGNNIGGYMDPFKRNVCAIRLRGEKSDGLFLPLKSLEQFGDVSTLREGDTIDVFNGHQICQKYIPFNRERTAAGGAGKRAKRRAKRSIAPLFYEHADTEQLAYNLSAFKPGDEIEITLKMHGTSQRTGYLPVFNGYKRSLIDRLFRREGVAQYIWGYVSGTRRTVLENYDGGYYGSNEFREQHSKTFEGKLWKGETVYYEVVGFTHTGAPIMADGKNEKLGKDFVKQYGKTTTFSYGCVANPSTDLENQFIAITNVERVIFNEEVMPQKPQSDIYVYRMTMTNEDGAVVEYTPDFMRYRCEQMGVKTVPVLWKGNIPPNEWIEECCDCEGKLGNWERHRKGNAGEWIKNVAEEYYDGPDPIGKTHVREGVVVRILNRPKFTAYKHKNFSFKVLEGIIKDAAVAPDIEEIQEVTE